MKLEDMILSSELQVKYNKSEAQNVDIIAVEIKTNEVVVIIATTYKLPKTGS